MAYNSQESPFTINAMGTLAQGFTRPLSLKTRMNFRFTNYLMLAGKGDGIREKQSPNKQIIIKRQINPIFWRSSVGSRKKKDRPG